MTVSLHWFLPTGGDGRTLVDRHAYTDGGIKRDRITPVSGVRAPDIEYLIQIAKAAEQLGFEAVLTPTGTKSPARHGRTCATPCVRPAPRFRPGPA